MPKITIYSTANCAFCHAEKEYLKSKNIAYKDIMIDEDPAQATYLYEKFGAMGVPFTHILNDDGTEEKILGFDRRKLDTVLNIKS